MWYHKIKKDKRQIPIIAEGDIAIIEERGTESPSIWMEISQG